MRNLKLAAVCAVLAHGWLGVRPVLAQVAPPSGVDAYIAWLDDPSRQWLATAHLQRVPGAAIARLLEPGRPRRGPHGGMTAGLLALAKIGEAAVPAVEARVHRILADPEHGWTEDVLALIDVLRAIGPPAIPALVRISETGDGWFHPLDAIVRMEPPTRAYGQVLIPWLFWRPADRRPEEIERTLGPLLPRIEQVLERALRRSDEHAMPPQRPAAYLLARWGTSGQRARGVEVLEDLVRSSTSFYEADESIRALHALEAPITASLVRLTVPMVPRGSEMTATWLLHRAKSLQQLGDHDYGSLVDEAITLGRPTDRIDAATFLGDTAALSHVPRLIAMLEDRTVWSGEAVADYALDALRRLTLQDLPADPAAWRAWFQDAGHGSRPRLVETWLAAKHRRVNDVPMWKANDWIAQLGATRDAQVLPLIRDYLRRSDLDAHARGRAPRRMRGDSGRRYGRHGPEVVSLLLWMAQERVPGAMATLDMCLDAADASVRMFGALALAAFDRERAADGLARELDSRHRHEAAEYLLELGDARGIPARIEALEVGAGIYGIPTPGDRTFDVGVRSQACRDLRVYSQQPLPCDPSATDGRLGEQVAAWRAWWQSSGSRQPLDLRTARLDLESADQVRPATIGSTVAH